jgi:hypothetical protein
MKNYYTLLWLLSLFAFTNVNAQVCPETLGNSSTSTLIHFKIAANSCNSYPSQITVESSTFDKISCNGTNLKYQLSSGNPLTIFDTFSSDFGSGMICDYMDGLLRNETLSVEQISNGISDLRVFPNPLTEGNDLNVLFSKNVTAQIHVYDISGKLILKEELSNGISKQINISSLNNGIYLLKIEGENTSTSRKIVVMK